MATNKNRKSADFSLMQRISSKLLTNLMTMSKQAREWKETRHYNVTHANILNQGPLLLLMVTEMLKEQFPYYPITRTRAPSNVEGFSFSGLSPLQRLRVFYGNIK